MAENINAEIISIGTEILLGEITDTNSVYIARALRDIGVNLYFMTSVGDNEQRITEAIRIALLRAQVVITTGGLGPTVDDVTRQAVARATNRELIFHQELLDNIAERFSGFRVNMTENNRRQAYLPQAALVIENPVGTAPSFIVEIGNNIIISLPGVPREMKFLMIERVIPYMRERYQLGVIKAHILRTAGIGESMLDDLIGEDLLQASNPTVGLAAHSGVVDVRITAKGDSPEEADRMIAEVEKQLRTRIGSYVFGTGDETIEHALINRLYARGIRLAVSETGIGGAISSRLQKSPAYKDVLAAEYNYRDPDALRSALNVDEEITLRDLAHLAAEKICAESGAKIGLAVVSNPDQMNDHADQEAGTAVAVHTSGETSSRVYGFGGQADVAQSWTSTWAMARAWQMLQSSEDAT
jgi:nicotinamide-nucleotide amidase